VIGLDRCLCYKCKQPFSEWESLGHPWIEHATQNPNCVFVQGNDVTNIPLSATLDWTPFVKHGNETQTITKLTSSNSERYVASISR